MHSALTFQRMIEALTGSLSILQRVMNALRGGAQTVVRRSSQHGPCVEATNVAMRYEAPTADMSISPYTH